MNVFFFIIINVLTFCRQWISCEILNTYYRILLNGLKSNFIYLQEGRNPSNFYEVLNEKNQTNFNS